MEETVVTRRTRKGRTRSRRKAAPGAGRESNRGRDCEFLIPGISRAYLWVSRISGGRGTRSFTEVVPMNDLSPSPSPFMGANELAPCPKVTHVFMLRLRSIIGYSVKPRCICAVRVSS